MLSLQCPRCGGTVYFEKDKPVTFCQFCGTHLGDMTKYVTKAVDFEFTKQEHAMHMETLDKEIRKSKISSIASTMSSIVDIIRYGALLLCVIVLIIISISIFLK